MTDDAKFGRYPCPLGGDHEHTVDPQGRCGVMETVSGDRGKARRLQALYDALPGDAKEDVFLRLHWMMEVRPGESSWCYHDWCREIAKALGAGGYGEGR